MRSQATRITSTLLAFLFGATFLSSCSDTSTLSSIANAPERPASSPSPEPTAGEEDETAESPPAKRPGLPDRGVCRQISFSKALDVSDGSKGRKCTGEHTAFTYFSGRLDLLFGGHLLAVDAERVQADVAERCPQRFAAFVGGSTRDQRLSMLRAIWFSPTLQQAQRGADWFRCDVVAVTGKRKLAALGKPRLLGVLDRPTAKRYAMCGTAAPDARSFTKVLCSQKHSWRAIDTVDFDVKRYPGQADARRRGQEPCEQAGRRVASDSLDFEWGYEFPTRQQWESGQRFGRCWAPD